jgi:class 3 adenylate cyclase
MSVTRKIAAILVADVVGYSRLAGEDEERTLARLRALRSDLIDPAIMVHHGRVVKRTGDGMLIEFAASSMLCATPSKCKTGWSSATRVCRLSAASSFALASTRAMSSRRPTETSWAMVSISPRGLRPSATPAASVYRRTPIAKPATRSKMRSSISASKP